MRTFLLGLALLALPAASFAGVFVSINIAPPALPVYVQPVCPAPGYIWTPGYWQYGPEGYFWVPGTWVVAPFVGGLWTPGYWGWGNGVYLWHAGYWGTHVGFYGGVNYGFGYTGVGFVGGRWNNGVFAYNRSVTNVNVTNIHNVYNERVVNNTTVNRVSYNGGAGGIQARPTPQEAAFARESHTPATSLQLQHERGAAANRAQLASVNHGNPGIAASPRPGVFSGQGVVRGGPAGGFNNAANHGVPPNRGGQNPAASRNIASRPVTPSPRPVTPMTSHNPAPQYNARPANVVHNNAPAPHYNAPPPQHGNPPAHNAAPARGEREHGR